MTRRCATPRTSASSAGRRRWLPMSRSSSPDILPTRCSAGMPEQLATLIEAHIGKDLQYIRINGTLVGGAIGLLLFLISHAAALWRSLLAWLG